MPADTSLRALPGSAPLKVVRVWRQKAAHDPTSKNGDFNERLKSLFLPGSRTRGHCHRNSDDVALNKCFSKFVLLGFFTSLDPHG